MTSWACLQTIIEFPFDLFDLSVPQSPFPGGKSMLWEQGRLQGLPPAPSQAEYGLSTSLIWPTSDKKCFFKKISNDYYITVNVLKTTELYTLKG